MFGAVIGDIVGSRFEFDNYQAKDFEFWHGNCHFTDDTVCTAAVADILLRDKEPARTMRTWCREYPNCSYGAGFSKWISNCQASAYKSYGNGAAMRVSPAALLYRANLQDALAAADRVTEITHNHPQGMNGARATTHAIWLALNDETTGGIRDCIEREYGYDLSSSVSEIRDVYQYSETCQDTVPQALICALESYDFEDVIRNAICIGGDSDTIAAIAGGIAEALHGCSPDLIATAKKYLDAELCAVMDEMYARLQ